MGWTPTAVPSNRGFSILNTRTLIGGVSLHCEPVARLCLYIS
jgi:hypothetical protein